MTSIPRSRARRALTPPATIFRASMSRPLSVSSRMRKRGSSMAIWKISIRFFSPPEKPTLSARFSMSKLIFRALAVARAFLRNSGDLQRILERQEDPPGRPFVGFQGQQVLAVQRRGPLRDLVARPAGQDVAQRRLA